MPAGTFFLSFFLNDFFLPALGCCFAMGVDSAPCCYLLAGLFLVGDGATARPLPRARIGMSALAADRQPAAVPQAAVGAHFDEPLDAHRDFLAQVAFDGALFLDNLAEPRDFLFAQFGDLLVEVDPCAVENGLRAGAPDSIDVRQTDLSPFPGRKIHACNASHTSCLLLTLPLLMLRVLADHAHHAVAVDDLALVTDFLHRCPDFHDNPR
jgi:hypothetical protein